MVTGALCGLTLVRNIFSKGRNVIFKQNISCTPFLTKCNQDFVCGISYEGYFQIPPVSSYVYFMYLFYFILFYFFGGGGGGVELVTGHIV